MQKKYIFIMMPIIIVLLGVMGVLIVIVSLRGDQEPLPAEDHSMTDQMESSSETDDASKETSEGDDQLILNDSLFAMFSTYQYQDYLKRFSVETVNTNTEGEVIIRFLHLNLEFYFSNTAQRTMISTRDGMPLEDAFPVRITADGLDQIASGRTDDFTAEDVKTNPGVSNVMTVSDDGFQDQVISFRYYSCSVKILCDDAGRVSGNQAKNEIVPDMPKYFDSDDSEPGAESSGENSLEPSAKVCVESGVESGEESGEETSLSPLPPPRPHPYPEPELREETSTEPTEVTYPYQGTIRDASTNELVTELVTVAVVSGGTTITGTSTSSGTFTMELPAGRCQFTLTANGYVTDSYSVYVSEGENSGVLIMSRIIAEGTVRVVLTWGSVPKDLDGNLIGLNSSGNNVEVCYSDPHGSDGCADLDIDDTQGSGCETITIHDIGGSYRYFVKRYSSDGSIGTSGAVVKIYSADGSFRTVIPPGNVDDVSWTVFTFENGNITSIYGIES